MSTRLWMHEKGVNMISATQMSLQSNCFGVAGLYGDTAENRSRLCEFRPFLFEQLSPMFAVSQGSKQGCWNTPVSLIMWRENNGETRKKGQSLKDTELQIKLIFMRMGSADKMLCLETSLSAFLKLCFLFPTVFLSENSDLTSLSFLRQTSC